MSKLQFCPDCERTASERFAPVHRAVACRNEIHDLADRCVEMAEVIDRAWAAIWDAHYGKGLSRGYAQSFDEAALPLLKLSRPVVAALVPKEPTDG